MDARLDDRPAPAAGPDARAAPPGPATAHGRRSPPGRPRRRQQPLTAALDASWLAGGADGSLSVELTTPLVAADAAASPADHGARSCARRSRSAAIVDLTPLANDWRCWPAASRSPPGTLRRTSSSRAPRPTPPGSPRARRRRRRVGRGSPPPTPASRSISRTGRSTPASAWSAAQHALLALDRPSRAPGWTPARSGTVCGRRRLRCSAVVGPLALQRLGLPASDRQPPRLLKGKVHADLTLDGSLRAPRLVAHAQASGHLPRQGAGRRRPTLAVNYAAHALGVETRLTSTNGGTLHLAAGTTADLGYPAVPRAGPRDARARRFASTRTTSISQGLSGMTPELRTVAGRLSATPPLRGTLADPRLAGRLEWKDGRLAFTGFGEYEGDPPRVARRRAEAGARRAGQARSGHGKARVTGERSHVHGQYEVAAARRRHPLSRLHRRGSPWPR